MQEEELRKGPWFEEEDEQLAAVVEIMGDKRWDSLAKASGTVEYFLLNNFRRTLWFLVFAF